MVSYDSFQDLAKLDALRKKEDWPWPVAAPVGTMLRDYNVVIWATKIGFDANGKITHRAGPGMGTDDEIRTVLQKLTASG